MTSLPIWRLAPGQRLQYRCWDGECVLYNDLSGDTHLLDEFALALLEQLRSGPQAAAQLAAAFELDAQDEAPMLQTVQDDLSALFLVEALPC